MNSWKVVLATVVIFGAGVLTGGLLVNHVVHEHRPLPGPRSPETWRKDFVGHLDKALKLTPEQHAAISKIVAEGQERNREIWHQEMERVHQRIRAELTPEQRKKFDAMIKQFAPHGAPRNRPAAGAPPATNNVPASPPGRAPGV
ncbi:MAG TPA: hypothetical protein VG077_00800 [Verrucomicrobiae bacterium]|nr:hypothetical protein [Verrucomicrobiae bacterium]